MIDKLEEETKRQTSAKGLVDPLFFFNGQGNLGAQSYASANVFLRKGKLPKFLVKSQES
jgi:hypothetical protein